MFLIAEPAPQLQCGCFVLFCFAFCSLVPGSPASLKFAMSLRITERSSCLPPPRGLQACATTLVFSFVCLFFCVGLLFRDKFSGPRSPGSQMQLRITQDRSPHPQTICASARDWSSALECYTATAHASFILHSALCFQFFTCMYVGGHVGMYECMPVEIRRQPRASFIMPFDLLFETGAITLLELYQINQISWPACSRNQHRSNYRLTLPFRAFYVVLGIKLQVLFLVRQALQELSCPPPLPLL